MKNYIKYLFIAIAAFAFVSCEDDPELLGYRVEANVSSMNFTAVDASAQTVSVLATGQWIAVAPEWIKLTPNYGTGNQTVTVEVADNLDTDGSVAAERSGVITFTIGDEFAEYSEVNVIQEGDPDKKPAEVEAISVADFIAAPESGSVYYELTGAIANIANSYYGNFDIVDETGSVYVYGLYEAQGGSYGAFEDLGLSEGDIITIRATRGSYGDLIEAMNAYYVSHIPSLVSIKPTTVPLPIEGGDFELALVYKGDNFEVTINDEAKSWLSMGTIRPDGDTTRVAFSALANDAEPRQAQISFTSTRLSDGTTSTVTVAVDQDGAIVTLDATIAEFIAAEENPNISYRLQGMVKEIQNNTWGNIVIEDVSGEVLVYGLLTEEGGESQQFASLGIKVGDVVTLVGKRDSYKDTPQVGDAYYESHYSPVTATVAEFLAAAESSDVWYRLTGTIENLSNTEYGNFNIVDATGSVYVYGLLTGLNGEKKQFASLGLAEGDNITLIGNRAAYKGDPQVGNAYFVSKNN